MLSRFALPLVALLLPPALHAQPSTPAPASTPTATPAQAPQAQAPQAQAPQAQATPTQTSPTQAAPAIDATHSLDAVKAAGRLSCGVIEAVEDWNGQDQHGDISNLEGEVCHAVAAAIFGDADKVNVVSFPGEPDALAALHAGNLQLVIGVSPSAEAAMQWGVSYGPAVFYDSERLMVLKQANMTGVADLRGRLICTMDGSVADQILRDEMTRRGIPYGLQAHSEQGEMDESVAVAHCAAGAATETRLADSRADFPPGSAPFVFLPERFDVEPMVPAWRFGDQRFGLIVQYTIDALVEAEALGITKADVETARTRTDRRARQLLGGDRSIANALGLQPDWAVHVIAAVGNYGELFDRTAGEKLHLERGLNALWTAGGLMHPTPMQ